MTQQQIAVKSHVFFYKQTGDIDCFSCLSSTHGGWRAGGFVGNPSQRLRDWKGERDRERRAGEDHEHQQTYMSVRDLRSCTEVSVLVEQHALFAKLFA